MSDIREQKDCQFYIDKIGTSEIHSLFTEAVRSTNRGLYLGASLCYVAGIEASIRGALARVNGLSFDDDYGTTLSNSLLKEANKCGLPVEALSMNTDENFKEAIMKKKPYVKIVKIRNILAHGNLTSFVERDLKYFTVGSLTGLNSELEYVSKRWILRLSEDKSNPF